jgi:hypothetical protein
MHAFLSNMTIQGRLHLHLDNNQLMRPTNWQLATGKDKDNRQCIQDQTLPNMHLCKFMLAVDIIATFCIAQDQVR